MPPGSWAENIMWFCLQMVEDPFQVPSPDPIESPRSLLSPTKPRPQGRGAGWLLHSWQSKRPSTSSLTPQTGPLWTPKFCPFFPGNPRYIFMRENSWTEEPGTGYSPCGPKESDTTERLTLIHIYEVHE